tara:strand:- start:1935 stop:3410 length:1476 start_codon:yes stop_codon:yes gene_type:complete
MFFKIITLIIFSSLILYPNDDWMSDDDISLDIVAPIKKTGSISYIEEHISGYTFSTYAQGEKVKKLILETRLRFQESWESFGFQAEYRYQHSYTNTPVINNLNEEYNKTITYDLSEFRELFFDYRLNSQISFRGGKQTIIWGQFSGFSPVDLLLPFDFSVIGPSTNKENLKQPIESYNLNVTPSNEWSHTLYYMPKFTVDFSTNERLNYAQSESNALVQYPTGSDAYQLAFRSVYNGNDLSYGVTVFKGFDTISMPYSSILSVDEDNFSMETQSVYMFPKRYAVAFEISKPINETDTIVFESVFQNRKKRFDNLESVGMQSLETEQGLAIKDYVEWVYLENSKQFYADQYMLISAIGFERSLSRHYFQLIAGYIHLINPDKTQKGVDLYSKTGLTEESDWTEDYRIVGALTYLYFLNDEKTHSMGTMLGFLGSGVGASTFYGLTLFESLTIGCGVEYIQYLSDLSFGSSSSGEQLLNISELTLRTALQWQF